jgi:hypothetical protein
VTALPDGVLDTFLEQAFPITWRTAPPEDLEDMRTHWRGTLADAVAAARKADPYGEWQTGYRDGLTAANAVARTCADAGDPATMVTALLSQLTSSPVTESV